MAKRRNLGRAVVKSQVADHTEGHAAVQPRLRYGTVGKVAGAKLEECLGRRDAARAMDLDAEEDASPGDEHLAHPARVEPSGVGAHDG